MSSKARHLRCPRRSRPRPHLIVRIAQPLEPLTDGFPDLVWGVRRRALLVRLGIDEAPPLEFVCPRGDRP